MSPPAFFDANGIRFAESFSLLPPMWPLSSDYTSISIYNVIEYDFSSAKQLTRAFQQIPAAFEKDSKPQCGKRIEAFKSETHKQASGKVIHNRGER